MKLVKYLCAIVLICSHVIADIECRPKMTDHGYVIGYGSLMNEKSLHSSIKDADSINPVIVKGFYRSFNFNMDLFGLKTTMLSVVEYENARMNAALIGIDENDLKDLDEREVGYCRKEVPRENIALYGDIDSDNLHGPIWIYVFDLKDDTKNDQYKIPQSYVDLFLGGCLEMEKTYSLLGFAKECVLTTHGWDQRQLVNDRIYPRRPWVYQPLALKVDKLLDELVPEVISSRKIES